MGIKMIAKYRGDCKVCGSEWKVGDQIYYQKDPKVICTDEPCYSEQGGSITKSFQSSFTKPTQSYQRPKVKFIIPDIEIPDGVKFCAEQVQQVIVVAHHLAISMYPELDTEDQTFGQIRSKLADQILSVCHMHEPKG